MAKIAKKGRPAFKPTTAQRRQVRNAAASGMTHEEIAVALEVHRHTLDKHFAVELSSGALHRRMEFLDTLARVGLKGNVTALKALIGMTPTLAAPAVEPEKPMGKKEQQAADAKTSATGTDWEELLPKGVTPIRKAG